MGTEKIKEFRQALGMGQVELASRVGVSQAFISQLENGTRSTWPDKLDAIAAELKCDVQDLTGHPSIWIQFMRNCKNLSLEQLATLNSMVQLLVKQNEKAKSPAVKVPLYSSEALFSYEVKEEGEYSVWEPHVTEYYYQHVDIYMRDGLLRMIHPEKNIECAIKGMIGWTFRKVT